MSVEAAADVEDWRRKYFDSLKQLTAEERRWETLESVLRRLISRLCIITRGHDPALDDSLNRLLGAMRDEADIQVLETLLADMGSVVVRDGIDAARPVNPAAPSAAAAAPLAIGDVFDSLLEQIAAGNAPHEALAALRQQLAEAQTPQALAEGLASLAQLIREQLSGLRQERAQVERTLQQFTAQLDEIHRYLAQEVAERGQTDSSHQDFNERVLGEVQALDTRIREASDLPTLQQQVAARLQAIGEHLRHFMSREEQRSRTYRERAQRMEARVRELDRETRRLQDSLREEQKIALTDALTAIPNRLAYDERIRHTLARLKRHNHSCVIAAWDIDHFKHINDTYGHPSGDKVLRIIGQLLQKAIRAADFVARYGGEEFVMLLEETQTPEASALAERLRVNVSQLAFHFRGQPLSITISCGLTALTKGDTPESAFERVDRLLYEAKHQGRNRCVVG